MPKLLGTYLRVALYLFDGQLLNEGVHIRADLAIRRHIKRKEGVGSGERVPILAFSFASLRQRGAFRLAC